MSARVNVCFVPLDAVRAVALSALSSEERTRAAGMGHRGARKTFQRTRAATRQIIGGALGIDPSAVRLPPGPGPLSVAQAPNLRLNVSHAGDGALVGWGHVEGLGVDLEPVGRNVDVELLARRILDAGERTQLAELNDSKAAFLRFWTAKEAWGKAMGDGVAAIGRLSLRLGDDHAIRITSIDSEPPDPAWSIHGLEPRPGYVGAIALRSHAEAEIHLTEYPAKMHG